MFSRERNYSVTPLFEFAIPNILKELDTIEASAYTPSGLVSYKFHATVVSKMNFLKRKETDNKDLWTSLKLYDSIQVNPESYIFYCGGPIQVLRWLPLPDDYTESQVLAVACRKNSKDPIYFHDIASHKCTIQLWNINKLENIKSKAGEVYRLPTLLYSIAFAYGPILDFAFCPSGGFTDDRYGLLAVPTSHSEIHILSLPKNVAFDNSEPRNSLVLALQPSIILKCSYSNTTITTKVTKIVWSRVIQL